MCGELRDWMNEKRSVLASDDLGKDMRTVQALQRKHQVGGLTISVLQPCCTVNIVYGIPSDIVRTSTLSLKAGLYRIWCGAHRLGDSGVHTLGDASAFVNPAGQLLLTLTVRGPTELDWCVMFSQAGTLFSWPPLLHCLLRGASLVVCVWSPTYRQEHLALSLTGYLWMVLAGRRGMCAHSGYFKICQCALVG